METVGRKGLSRYGRLCLLNIETAPVSGGTVAQDRAYGGRVKSLRCTGPRAVDFLSLLSLTQSVHTHACEHTHI